MAPFRTAAFLAAIVLAAAALSAHAQDAAPQAAEDRGGSLAVDLVTGPSTTVQLSSGALARTADAMCPNSDLIQCFCRNDGMLAVSELNPIAIPYGRKNRVSGGFGVCCVAAACNN